MTRSQDGGAAFPRASGPEPRVDSATDYTDGMSLRDYFAAHAPLLASTHDHGVPRPPVGSSDADWFVYQLRVLAASRYAYADAMLRAREGVGDA